MSNYRAVLFDMDGVIVDSEPHWERIWREEVFPRFDGDPGIDEVIGRDYTETVPELAEKYGLGTDVETVLAEMEARAVAIYAEEAGTDPDLVALFDAIRERGLDVGIVSSSPRDWIRQVVDRFDLGPLSVIVSAGEIDGPGKPAPGVYERAIADLGADPGACIVIEDSENGVRAAAAAGATVIRFQQSGSAESLPEADAVAEDPAELRAILEELLSGT